jgi:hypothetical protein
MLPRFHLVAMSMKRVQIRIARVAVIPIDLVHLDPVVMLEEQPTITTPATLRFSSTLSIRRHSTASL